MNGVIIIKGKLPGPTVCILGGVHGNELPGILALNQIKDQLRVDRGTVILIYGNPRAIEAGQRLIEQNLNRMFRDDCSVSEKQSYEYERALYIRKFLDEADLCLDLHASYSQDTVPFAITEENGFQLAKLMPVKYICSNIDAFEPGGTDGYMYRKGKVGLCVECGYLGDESAVSVALECVEKTLRYMQMIDGAISTKGTPTLLKVTGLYFNKARFVLSKEWPDFAEVGSGEVIGKDGDVPICYPENYYLLFARNLSEAGKEAFLLLKKHQDV